MVEQALEEELTEHLAARLLERTPERRGYRNGHYRRRLLSRYGEIPDLAVPRTEDGSVEFQTLGRYQRRQIGDRQDIFVRKIGLQPSAGHRRSRLNWSQALKWNQKFWKLLESKGFGAEGGIRIHWLYGNKGVLRLQLGLVSN